MFIYFEDEKPSLLTKILYNPVFNESRSRKRTVGANFGLNDFYFYFFRTFPSLYDIQRYFKDHYNRIRIDESGALRWLKPGFMQLIFNFPMLAIGCHFGNVETCAIDDISEVLVLLGGVMTISAVFHIILGIFTHCCNANDEKGCFKFLTWAWTTVPIFSTYWVIVIGTGIAQFALQCKAYPVFFGTWPCEAMPSVDYDDKFAENFCEKAPFMYELITCFHEFCNYESTKKKNCLLFCEF